MKINPLEYTFNDVIEMLDNKYVNSLDCLNYGKTIQNAVEIYIEHQVNEIYGGKFLIDVQNNPQFVIDYQYNNNGPGFDKLLLLNKKKIQIKFRQVDGKTPYSRQVHFENTRRHSKKNQNESAESGLIRYRVSEFDYVIVVLCHINNNIRPNYKEWKFSVINSKEIEDVNKLGYCLPKIPSSTILKNKVDNIYMLTNKLKDLQYE
jgi:hypothetical protein